TFSARDNDFPRFRSFGANTTTCRSTTSAMPRRGTISTSRATSNRATAWYAIVATARCSRWPRSSAMSIASEKKRQWSAPAWSQAQLSRERPANPGCHPPTLLDLVEERSTRFRAFHLTIVPHGLVFVTKERHGTLPQKSKGGRNER